MGTIYKQITKKGSTRWRVQVRHQGFKNISMNFDTEEEALEFHDEMDEIMKKKVKERRVRIIKNSL